MTTHATKETHRDTQTRKGDGPITAGPEPGTFVKRRGLVPLATALALLGPGTFLMIVGYLIHGAMPVLTLEELANLAGTIWSPHAASFGVLSLVTSSLLLGLGATALSLALGIPAAIRLAVLAPPGLRAAGEATLSLLAGLPSVIVGLVGLFYVVPTLGFSVAAALVTLTLMSWPTATLLIFAALRQQGDDIQHTAVALGIPPRVAAYRLVLRGIRATLVRIAFLVCAKAIGEATAVSFVIGNRAAGALLPHPFEAAHALTSVILKDHGAAAGEHLAAVYAVGLILAGLILALNLAGAAIARRIPD